MKKEFRSAPNFSEQKHVNVDRENSTIKNIEIAKYGRNKNLTFFDDKFLDDLVKKGNEQKQGVKSRFGHPNMCASSLGTFVGRYKNFRVENRKAYADLTLDPITKKNYTNKRYSRGHSTSVLYKVLKDRLGVNILGFYLIGKRFNHLSRDISFGTKDAPDPHELMRTWRKEKSYVASNYLGYDKLYYIKDGQDLNVDNEDFVVKEDASKSQLTKAFKNFNKRKLTNRIVLKSFAEMVA